MNAIDWGMPGEKGVSEIGGALGQSVHHARGRLRPGARIARVADHAIPALLFCLVERTIDSL